MKEPPQCQSRNSSAYDTIARSQLAHDYAAAFHRATGFSLRLAPANVPGKRIAFGREENLFCKTVVEVCGGCRACLKIQEQLQQRLRRKLAPQQLRCFAGLTDVAVPVLVGGEHVATLFGGQVFLRNERRRGFGPIARAFASWGANKDLTALRRAYFQIPVVSKEQFRAMMRLLILFAQQLGESANRWMLATHRNEPPPVAQAKDFVRANAQRQLTMREAAQHVQLSPSYFCRLFKKATNMTFSEYVCRARIEKAKPLLANPSLSISETALAAGFGSIPHFERMFKRYAGVTPSQYRAASKR